MAVVLHTDAYDDPQSPRVRRRSVDDGNHTCATRFPPYVYAAKRGALMHRVARVELDWWRIAGRKGEWVVKLRRPAMHVYCVCGQVFFLEPERAHVCTRPNPEALLCGRCQGEAPSFSKSGAATAAGLTRTAAHAKLGCVVAAD